MPLQAPSAPASTPLHTDPASGPCCEHCDKPAAKAGVLVAMQPGKDGVPWYLCGRCWLDGRYPGKLGILTRESKQKAPVVVTDPAVADALKKSGWREATPDAPNGPGDVADYREVVRPLKKRAAGRGRGSS